MKTIRTLDTIEIENNSGILWHKGGFDVSGRWSVLSTHDEYAVVFRGGRLMKVNIGAIVLVEPYDDFKEEDQEEIAD
jgi:hypothetical protein